MGAGLFLPEETREEKIRNTPAIIQNTPQLFPPLLLPFSQILISLLSGLTRGVKAPPPLTQGKQVRRTEECMHGVK